LIAVPIASRDHFVWGAFVFFAAGNLSSNDLNDVTEAGRGFTVMVMRVALLME
jgi:hypothetical protein